MEQGVVNIYSTILSYQMKIKKTGKRVNINDYIINRILIKWPEYPE